MVHPKISSVVKAIRLRYAVPIILILIVVYWSIILPWMTNWGSTLPERQMVFPGDELHPNPAGHTTKAITINASPEVIWQWLIQIGQDRAGYYSYTWLENLVGANIHNVNEIRPEWQHLSVGDAWRLTPPDYLGDLGEEMASKVLISLPQQALVLEMFGAYNVIPIDEHTTRLIVRGEQGPTNLLTTMVANPVIFTMERRMLLGLKARAEGRPDTPTGLMAIALLGWIVAGLAIVVLFMSETRRRFWLVLSSMAALPALVTSRDPQAALAAFLAVGITVLGFLTFGRNWWGAYSIIGSLVLLTLLLTPEAYVAIGMGFVLLLILNLSLWITDRSRFTHEAEQRLAAQTH